MISVHKRIQFIYYLKGGAPSRAEGRGEEFKITNQLRLNFSEP